MCTPKPPKINPASPQAKLPDPAIIRNPYLDNVNAFAQGRKGRSQLRIAPGSPSTLRIPLPTSAAPTSRSPIPSASTSTPSSGYIATPSVGVRRAEGRTPDWN